MVHNHRDMQLKKSMSVEIGSGEILLISVKRKKLQDMKLRGYRYELRKITFSLFTLTQM